MCRGKSGPGRAIREEKSHEEVYVTEGSVRGRCPHKHRSLEAAERCLASDHAGCRQQGGYSDRQIMALEDGRAVPLTEDEELFLWRCDE